jgi:hypothetical protein
MSPENTDKKKCRCGHTRDHPWVVPKPRYSLWGWILVGFGISHPPVEVRYECDKCGEVFERITDPKVLKNHIYR